MTRIAHLSDLHVDGSEDRRARLTRALGHAWDLADYLVLTGDLTAWGERKDFQELGSLLEPWAPERVTLVPGNHDLESDQKKWPEPMLGTKLEKFYRSSRPGAVTDLGGAYVVALSTQNLRRALAFRALGQVSEKDMKHAERVAKNTTRCVVLAMHHGPQWHLLQPFDGLTNRHRVHEFLDAYPNAHVLCGHDHRSLDLGRVFAAPAIADSENPLRLYDVMGASLVPV